MYRKKSSVKLLVYVKKISAYNNICVEKSFIKINILNFAHCYDKRAFHIDTCLQRQCR